MSVVEQRQTGMRIAYLTSLYARAADTFVRGEVRELRRLGHSVHTFSIRRPNASELVSAEVREEYEQTEYMLSRGFARLILSAIQALLRWPGRLIAAAMLAAQTNPGGARATLYQLIYLVEACHLAVRMRSLRVEHLHNHISENSCTVAMLASTIAGIPFSFTVHGPGEFYAPRHWALARKIDRAAFVACISEFCRSQCMVFGAQRVWPKLQIIRCGLDATFLGREEAVPVSCRLVTVGRLVPEKGFLVLLDAARQLKQRGVKFDLVILGDGPLSETMADYVHRHGLVDCVTLKGWAGSAQVRQELLASRALILPSFAEGLPVVIMEAMALARPVISTYIAGIPELVEPGVNGWLVPAGSVEALVDAMRAALTCPVERLEEMGRDGARRVREHHNVATEAAKLAELFRQSVAERLEGANGFPRCPGEPSETPELRG